ncbi:MAG TPA: HEPN domain-containing protein [Dehalococcoidia bacterium]|nr:HEPN domain-containing protein [Dehalococcoidia bacterium]
MTDRDPNVWIQFALDDLAWAKHTSQGGFFSRTCFAAQQAAEKALKAYLLERTRDYPQLISLLSLAVELDARFAQLKPDCDVLDEYYLPSRYPLVRPSRTFELEDAQDAIERASRIVSFVRARLA